MKTDFVGDPQALGDARAMEFLLRKPANREWIQLKTKKCVAVNKDERIWRSEEHFDISNGDTEFGVCPAEFWVCYDPVLPHYAPFPPFEMVMCILCHWNCVICFFILILQEVTVRLP